LRLSAHALAGSLPERRRKANVQGVAISKILAEPEPIGGFAGVAISEPVLQAGNLLSVFGYMLYVEPLLAAISIAMFSPQFVFVPLPERSLERPRQLVSGHDGEQRQISDFC
jgi:hypothetical protein